MKTENKNSEKDLNGNPESRLNTNKPLTGSETFPESPVGKEEMENKENEDEKDSDIELLAGDVAGSVGDRATGSSPADGAGISDLDRGMRRAKRR